MAADDEQENQETSKNRELLKWLGLEEKEGEKSTYARTNSPGWWFKPRLQVGFYSRLEPPTGIKGLARVGGSNRD
jgi:hypothetical protein